MAVELTDEACGQTGKYKRTHRKLSSSPKCHARQRPEWIRVAILLLASWLASARMNLLVRGCGWDRIEIFSHMHTRHKQRLVLPITSVGLS